MALEPSSEPSFLTDTRVVSAQEEVRAPRDLWQRRDWLAAALLSAATAATVLWQNAHVVVLWDASYVLDSAVRIADGQMPYRDFPFVHAPLTFLLQAAILRLFGHVFWHHVLYAAVAGAASTVLTWRIVLDTLRGRVQSAWVLALILAAPLAVVGIYCIVPLPNYDCDCGVSVLLAVWLLRRLHASVDRCFDVRSGIWRGLIAGAAACVPLFFKQNIGLPFLASVVGVVLWLLLLRALRSGEARDSQASPLGAMPLIGLLAGVAAALLVAALAIHATAGIANYLHWTIHFAAQRRLPGASVMLGVYRDPTLLGMLPCVALAIVLLRSRAGEKRWARVMAMALFAAPFLVSVAALFLYDDADERGDALLALWPLLLVLAGALALVRLVQSRRRASLTALLPLVLLAAIHGAFLSQQLWGSTYGVWPLLVLLLAEMIVFIGEIWPAPAAGAADSVPFQNRRSPHWFTPALAGIVSATLLVCGGFYTASEERLSYAHLFEDAQFPHGAAAHSAFPALKGMATPGPYLPEFDELLRYAAANIPERDALILIPGEDPFYFATDRVPQFPVLLFDPATDPYSPEQIAALARTRDVHRLGDVHWLIVKRDLQSKADPTPQREATIKLLLEEFTPAAHLRGYDVYRR